MARAKTLPQDQFKPLLVKAATSRLYGRRNAVMLLFSFKAGLRAAEIANLTWSMVTDSSGLLVDEITLPAEATKGGYGGRTIPMHPYLKAALRVLMAELRVSQVGPEKKIIRGQRGWDHMSAHAIHCYLARFYKKAGLHGMSSHSGRRTFITQAARQISKAGGSLRDVQALAGHASLATTERYIDENQAAKRRLMDLI